MLKRKAYRELFKWKNNTNKKQRRRMFIKMRFEWNKKQRVIFQMIRRFAIDIGCLNINIVYTA
mgnify:CR=1 FL=1